MRTIIFLSAMFIAAAINIEYYQKHELGDSIVTVISFVWDILDYILKRDY